eukprot:1161039-Pelagomonas_calceolata.AAC.4
MSCFLLPRTLADADRVQVTMAVAFAAGADLFCLHQQKAQACASASQPAFCSAKVARPIVYGRPALVHKWFLHLCVPGCACPVPVRNYVRPMPPWSMIRSGAESVLAQALHSSVARIANDYPSMTMEHDGK